MKILKQIIPMAVLLLGSTSLLSQTIYDVNRLIGSDLNGTARFVGMGGAMGALGGDISTMGTNPAGIGIYRSSDIMTSFGFSNVGAKSNFNGSKVDTDKFFGSFDNAGFVIALEQGTVTPLRFVNFGFNYSKQKSFDKNMVMGGRLNGALSQTDQMAWMADGKIIDGDDPYYNTDVGWLSVLGYNTWLISPEYTTKVTGYPYLDREGNQFYDEETGNPLYINYENYTATGFNPFSDFSSRERGGLHNYDFNLAFNFNDRFYLGATLGLVDVDYSKETFYSESSEDGSYSLENWFDTKGIGVNFKLGGIVRVFDNLRLGAAVHIPTFYHLTDYNSARLISNIDGERYEQNTYNEAGEGRTKYDMTTPWKYNLSLGYTVGRNVALGAEYEFIDYSTAKLKDDDGVKMDMENGEIKNYLKGAHTLRLGAEVKVAPPFSLRAGYNLITSSFENDAFKYLPINTIRTDTEYANIKSIHNFMLGFGYRSQNFYADMAYKYQTYKEDFYAFDNTALSATKVTNDKHQLLFTLGMRF